MHAVKERPKTLQNLRGWRRIRVLQPPCEKKGLLRRKVARVGRGRGNGARVGAVHNARSYSENLRTTGAHTLRRLKDLLLGARIGAHEPDLRGHIRRQLVALRARASQRRDDFVERPRDANQASPLRHVNTV